MVKKPLSARVCNVDNGPQQPSSPKEVDNMQRSTKKAKGNENPSAISLIPPPDTNMEDQSVNISYKDRLLNVFGEDSSEEMLWGEVESELSENKWYKFDDLEAKSSPKPLDPRPKVSLTDEELDAWSIPWRNTLIVSVLGKRVSFKLLEAKVNRIWTKTGPIKVTDLDDGFFLVRLSCQEDYKHALFEGMKSSEPLLGCAKMAPSFLFFC